MSSIRSEYLPDVVLSADLVARPDHALIPFSLSLDDLDPARAVAAARPLLAAVDERLSKLSARLLVRGLRTSHGEAKIGDPAVRTALDGVVDVDLPQGSPVDRALHLATLISHLRALAAEGRKQKPPLLVSIGQPTALLRDPEKHRGELVARWGRRLREAVEATSAAGASLAPLALVSPGAVRQTPQSLEQVELTLEIWQGLRENPAPLCGQRGACYRGDFTPREV